MHLFSTLLDANTINKQMREEENIQKCIDWCKASGIHKIYIESYRGAFIEQELLEKLRDRFEEEGILAHGCVTPVNLPRTANNRFADPAWNVVGCYSSEEVHEKMDQIFRRTAAVFDVIMVDDFLFTHCTCEHCQKAKGGRTWGEYHSDIVHEVSVDHILKPAKEVNPNCKIIIKYPLWYDTGFEGQGYDTIRQTRDFDRIWIGTETREPDIEINGLYPQTQGFFTMAWAMRLDEKKCGGGWYDPYDTKPETYLEQARQTILGKAKESMLFCYSSLADAEGGQINTEAWRKERAGLVELTNLLTNKEIVGVSVPKQPHVDAATEKYLSSCYGMLGLPICPEIVLDKSAKSVILGDQANHYPGVRDYVREMKEKGAAIAYTDAFLAYQGLETDAGIPAFSMQGDKWNIIRKMSEEDRNTLRDHLMKPLGVTFRGPASVALNMYDDDMEVLQNFNDFDVTVTIDLFGRNHKTRKLLLTLSADKKVEVTREGYVYTVKLPARTLAVLG